MFTYRLDLYLKVFNGSKATVISKLDLFDKLLIIHRY